MARILVVTPRYPYPLVGGDRLRIFNVCRQLAREHELTLASLCETEAELNSAVPNDGVFRTVHRVLLPRWRSRLNVLLALAGSEPLQLAYYRCPEFARLVSSLARGADAVVGHLIRSVPYITGVGRARILEMTDSVSLVYERARSAQTGWSVLSAVYRIELQRVLRYEATLPRKVDSIVLVSATDRQHLAQRLREDERSNVLVCENGVDLESLPFDRAPDGRTIIFIGNMQTLQNSDAALFFAREVMPLILERRPEARFRVIGRIQQSLRKDLLAYRGVEVAGEVGSIAAAARGATVGVCPMRLGAGIQNKILEYMALGVPAVISSMCSAAFRAATGGEFIVADAPPAIADAVVPLLADPAVGAEQARRARNFVEQHYSWERNLMPLHDLLRSTGSR